MKGQRTGYENTTHARAGNKNEKTIKRKKNEITQNTNKCVEMIEGEKYESTRTKKTAVPVSTWHDTYVGIHNCVRWGTAVLMTPYSTGHLIRNRLVRNPG